MPSSSEQKIINTDDEAEYFSEYWRRNYPDGTTIVVSEWHRERLSRFIRHIVSDLSVELETAREIIIGLVGERKLDLLRGMEKFFEINPHPEQEPVIAAVRYLIRVIEKKTADGKGLRYVSELATTEGQVVANDRALLLHDGVIPPITGVTVISPTEGERVP